MDYDLTEEQILFDNSLRAMLAENLPLERLRAICESEAAFDPDIWTKLVEFGVPGLIVSDSSGGSELGILDCLVAAEALGHAGLPAPFLSSAVLAPYIIERLASTDQKSETLPAVVSGELRAAVAFEAATGTTSQCTLTFGSGSVTGHIDGVLDLAGATHILLLGANGNGSLFDIDQPGIEVSVEPSLDRTRSMGKVRFNDASGLKFATTSTSVIIEALQIGRAIVAADTMGAMQYMNDAAVSYAKERTQFGRVIGSFQALKHVCAEMAAMLEPCRALIWYVGYAFDQELEDAPALANHAKAHLSEVSREVARLATETHGGMGFTDLLGLHIWFKRIAQNRQIFGTPEHCRRDAARLQGWIPA